MVGARCGRRRLHGQFSNYYFGLGLIILLVYWLTHSFICKNDVMLLTTICISHHIRSERITVCLFVLRFSRYLKVTKGIDVKNLKNNFIYEPRTSSVFFVG